MKSALVPIQVRLIFPAQSGCAIFLGNEEKTFVIHVEPQLGHVIGMFLQGQNKERPLTHDLMLQVFKGFGISVERVIISELRNGTFYARLFLRQENELGSKIIDVDARPSDCIALATAQKRPIFATRQLLESVDDMTAELEKLGEAGTDQD